MKQILIACLFIGMCSCTFFKKDLGDDEMLKMSESVLKRQQGIDIQFKPISKEPR